MPLNYSVAMMGNPIKADEPKKAYAKAQISEELSLKELSRQVAAQTTVSRADVSAVLIATVENLLEALHAGKQADFGELGKFRLQITSRGAVAADKFTAANITGVNIQYVPGEDLQNVFAGMEFNPVPTRAATRALLKAQKAGQTTVDISKGGSSSGGNESKPGEGGGSGNDQNENPLE